MERVLNYFCIFFSFLSIGTCNEHKIDMLFQTPEQRTRVLCLFGCSTLFPLLVFGLMICGEPCRFDDDPKRFSDIQLISVSVIAFVYCVLSILLTRELFDVR